jgi:hypothetical protein
MVTEPPKAKHKYVVPKNPPMRALAGTGNSAGSCVGAGPYAPNVSAILPTLNPIFVSPRLGARFASTLG